MGTFENKIAEAIRSLAASLQLSMLLPASLLIGGLIWLLMPSALTSNNGMTIFIGVAVITVSYLLNAFNMPIVRLLEGYIMADSPLVSILRDYQLYKYYRHHHRIYIYERIISQIDYLENKWRRRCKELPEEMERRLERWRTEWQSLATGLGNTIAAFEIYPQRRYRIDIAQLWPRFAPTLVEKKYADFIEGEKAILDFFVNLLLVSIIIWGVCVIVFAFTGRPGVGLLFVLLPVLAYVLYKGACVAAANWGDTMKSAFDLYRFELKKALNLQLPEGAEFSDEQAMWRGISDFLAHGILDNFGGFDYASMYAKEAPSQKKEEEK
jgi:hypothetical protein